jgi:hypothetical protein
MDEDGVGATRERVRTALTAIGPGGDLRPCLDRWTEDGTAGQPGPGRLLSGALALAAWGRAQRHLRRRDPGPGTVAGLAGRQPIASADP